MCGITGYVLQDYSKARQAFAFFEQLLIQSQIRGLHSTGVAWTERGRLYSERVATSAKEFVETNAMWQKLRNRNVPESMIAHCRYSTSGEPSVENAQPICNEEYAIVHNGLVSMEEPDKLERDYGVELNSTNDTEIILQKMAQSDGEYIPWKLGDALAQCSKIQDIIYAIGVLDKEGNIYIARDDIRPLWIFRCEKLGIVGFASTKDIIKRACRRFGVAMEDLGMQVAKLPAGSVYLMNGTTVEAAHKILVPRVGVDTSRYKKPALPSTKWLRNKELTDGGRNLTYELALGSKWDHREHPRESFKLYSLAACASWEIDPNYPMLNYLFRRYELSLSQQLWWCWLYGVFYHPGSVFYVAQEFPDYEKVDVDRLEAWHAKNWKLLRYNKDRKYEKGHLVPMFKSYVNVIGSQHPGSQEAFFRPLISDEDPKANFRAVHKQLMKLYRFGRYAVYIYTEALHRCAGMPILADNMFLKDAASPRAGLCIAIGRPDWAKGPLSVGQWIHLETEAAELLKELQQQYPTIPFDPWLMESCFCAYKGYFARGRYLGYYLDRMADEILQMQAEDITSGIDWSVLWQFRREYMPWEYLGEYNTPPRLKIESSWRHVLRDKGQMIGLSPVLRRMMAGG